VGEQSPFSQNVCPGFGWYSNDNVVDRKMLGGAHAVKSYRDTGGRVPDDPRGGGQSIVASSAPVVVKVMTAMTCLFKAVPFDV
jgi:hypothetical protein